MNFDSRIVLVREARPVARFSHPCLICGQSIRKDEEHILMVYADRNALNPHKALKSIRYHLQCPIQL